MISHEKIINTSHGDPLHLFDSFVLLRSDESLIVVDVSSRDTVLDLKCPTGSRFLKVAKTAEPLILIAVLDGRIKASYLLIDISDGSSKVIHSMLNEYFEALNNSFNIEKRGDKMVVYDKIQKTMTNQYKLLEIAFT